MSGFELINSQRVLVHVVGILNVSVYSRIGLPTLQQAHPLQMSVRRLATLDEKCRSVYWFLINIPCFHQPLASKGADNLKCTHLSKEMQPVNFLDLGKLKSVSGNQLYAITGTPDLKNINMHWFIASYSITCLVVLY